MERNRRETIAMLAGAAPAALGILSTFGVKRVYAQAPKPNMLFILVDNLGYGELGIYGGGMTRGAPTPRIDKLASEGLRLTNMNMEAQ
jgi:arylsulfatase